MSSSTDKKRPEYRNIHVTQILTYRLPLAGKLSILHRVSGAVLFLALLTVLLPLFDLSLSSERSFEQAISLMDMPLVKLVLLGLIWSFLHHFFAGLRFLALDVHMGIEKCAAQKSSAVVFGLSLSLTAIFGLMLFGVI